MFLLDTNVISELRRPDTGEPQCHRVGAARFRPRQFFPLRDFNLEIELGALADCAIRTRRKERFLRTWIDDQISARFEGRILAGDTVGGAALCRTLHVPDPRGDRDALIAATADGPRPDGRHPQGC